MIKTTIYCNTIKYRFHLGTWPIFVWELGKKKRRDPFEPRLDSIIND